MSSLIVYGSLINKAQLYQKLNLQSEACPVFIQGYRRIFNQEPSWRQGFNQHRAVLNIVKSATDYFNGLLVDIQDDSAFEHLDKREKGYERITINCSQLAHFTDTSCSICSEATYIYLGHPGKQNNGILPNREYLELCLRGAKQWGEEFYKQFVQTTYVGTHTLEIFLRNKA
ncbi:MAG: gamma-glutamylcyclotransferase family protein [Cyanobacteria bacterium P01_D01_bin.105]